MRVSVDVDEDREDLLAYVLVPNELKFVQDLQPFCSANLVVPVKVLKKRQKERKKLENRAISHAEMLAVVLSPDFVGISQPAEIVQKIDKHANLAARYKSEEFDGLKIPLQRLSMWTTKNLLNASRLLDILIERRDCFRFAGCAEAGFKVFRFHFVCCRFFLSTFVTLSNDFPRDFYWLPSMSVALVVSLASFFNRW